MHEHDRQRDGWTDTERQQRPRLRIASRGKNIWLTKFCNLTSFLSFPLIQRTYCRIVISQACWGQISLLKKTSCRRADPTICPASHVTLTFDLLTLKSGIRVTCDVGYLCANFGLPRPLCSSYSRCMQRTDRRQTDRQTSSDNVCMYVCMYRVAQLKWSHLHFCW